MSARTGLTLLLAAAIAAVVLRSTPISACCPAPPSGKPVVNADQTVILIWDAATKTQHFIRRASFRSEADDFGFLVPTPARPELEESGNEAFPYLQKLTEPERIKRTRPSEGMNCGCGCASPTKDTATKSAGANVTVLETKRVAGFNATVLQAGSADALVRWLKDHGYAFSPEVEAWAKPYVEAGWKINSLLTSSPNVLSAMTLLLLSGYFQATNHSCGNAPARLCESTYWGYATPPESPTSHLPAAPLLRPDLFRHWLVFTQNIVKPFYSFRAPVWRFPVQCVADCLEQLSLA